MATHKHAHIRYKILDKCFQQRYKYCIDGLLEACNEELRDLYGKESGIKKRQLYADLNYLKSTSGYSIELDTKTIDGKLFYSYSNPKFSIYKPNLNDKELSHIKDALHILSRFQGLPHFEWVDETIAKFESKFALRKGAEKIVGFDENKYYTGIEHFKSLFKAILNKQTLEINYHSYKSDKAIDVVFHPYFIKQYNNRWFCLGLNAGLKKISVYALDRIKNIDSSKARYIVNKKINFEEYFDDVVGVTIKEGNKLEKITIQVQGDHWPYIKSKPLHGSQKIKYQEKDFAVITIEVIPNFELEALLLSHGNKIDIIAPKSFRKVLYERAIYQ